MSDFATKLLPMVKKTLRQADNEFDDEIGSYIDTVATDLQDAGIHYSFFSSTKPGWVLDGQILQACRWYALSVFGLYNPDMEKYALAYASLKATLATQKRYTIKGQYPTGYEEGFDAGYTAGYSKGEANGESTGYDNALSNRTDLVVTENGEYTPSEDSTGFKNVKVDIAFRSPFDDYVEGNTTEISSGASKIASKAFYGWETPTSANFPNATEIGDSAFRKCIALTSANSQNATKIGTYAFEECKKLTSVDFPNVTNIGSYGFSSCSALISANFPKATKTGSSSFSNCSALTSVKFPNATQIDDSSFSNCRALMIADFPNVTSIAYSSFGNCYNLKSVTLRSETMCKLSSTSAFGNCYHFHGTVNSTYNPNGDKDGYFYVPRALVESYKSATNWATYATQFRALEDYTVDGTTTGELDPNKI